MGYFGRLKKYILTIFLIFCTLPLALTGGYIINLSFRYNDAVLLIVGIGAIVIAAASMLYNFFKLAKQLKPLEEATDRLCSTLNAEEREVLTLSAEESPSKFMFTLVDYLAGKRMVAGSSQQQRNLFEAAADCTDEIIWRRDQEGDTYYIPEIWRMRYPELVLENGVPLENYIHPDNAEEFRSAIEIMTAKPGRKAAINVRLRAGEEYVSAGITARSAEIGGMVCAAGAFSDTEKIAEFETTIQEKYLMYHFALRAVSDIIYEVDVPGDRYSVLNPDQWNTMFDIPLNGDFSFHRASYAELIHPDNLEGFRDRFGNYDHLLFMPDRSITYDYRIKRRNGDWIWVRHSIISVKDEDGKVLKVIGNISDINEKKRQEFREMYDHRHDSLTGAYLRSTLEADFIDLVNVQKKPAIVMSVDIDSFKDVVEYYGYRAGDIVLRQFVLLLWENQMGRCSVGRIGNDDFIIIMKEVNDNHRPEIMAERIINSVIDPIKAENQQIVITVSIGWSEYGKDGTDFSELIDKAEAARVRAHTLGKNRYAVYEESEARI